MDDDDPLPWLLLALAHPWGPDDEPAGWPVDAAELPPVEPWRLMAVAVADAWDEVLSSLREVCEQRP